MNSIPAVEETVGPSLKYTEETGRTVRSLPVRYCYLWQAGVEEPVSDLEVLSFRQRFGAVSIPAEGIGGVETLPQFRRQGHIRKVLTQAMAGSAKRVPVLFVSDAIEDMYEQFGFVNCLAEAHLVVPVRNVERMASSAALPSTQRVRSFNQTDLPAMIHLYNEIHAHRPWTHERPAEWNRLLATQTWQPGSAVMILERDESVVGYAIGKEQQFGHAAAPFVIDELATKDAEAARTLLVEVAARCWQMRFSEFWVREPLDSVVGQEAQRLGCEYRQIFPPSGGMMGAILDRQQLLAWLEPELQRRLPGGDLGLVHTTAFAALTRGEVVSDNRVLLRLLLGYWSMLDALALGTAIPEHYLELFAAWFPGGGTRLLPMPYAHKLDRY